MINLFVIGNIGRDATINETNGRKAINFAVAHNSSYKDQSGSEIKKTIWVNCTLWRDKDQKASVKEYLKAGVLVAVHGEPSVRTFKNKDGAFVAAMDLNVNKLELLSSSKHEETSNTEAEQTERKPY